MPFSKTDIYQIFEFLRLFKPRQKNGVYYQNIAIVGLFCIFLASWDLNNLLIPIHTLILLGITSSVLVTLIFIKFYKRELGVFWAFLHNLTFGIICIYLLIQTNDFLSFKAIETKDYYIEKLELKHNNIGRSNHLKPIIIVKIENVEHKLSLNSDFSKEIQKTRYVKISLKQGFWNFPIVKKIELAKNE